MSSTPQKDVVYIDVEDDITAIIGKLKDTKQSIVALVPPKRIGVLQSSVNLRLLARAAGQNDKRLVIITGNTALASLAASAKIPIAKNLQSKPELGEIAALDIDNGEEIIDGAQLPIGEHAKQAAMGDDSIDTATALGAAALEDPSGKPSAVASRMSRRGKSKVPNFDVFRKKLFLFGALGVFIVTFFVWAIWFAPHATVVLSTRTTSAAVSQQVTLGADMTTDSAKSTIKAEMKTSTEEINIPFTATGKKDVGEKATGSVTFSNDSASALFMGIDIPAGTSLESSDGEIYTTDESVQLNLANLGNASVDITASESGAKYNGASGSMSGAPSGVVATLDGSTSGGTDKTVTVVARDDVDKARNNINDEIDEATAKQTLSKQFGDGYTVIADSFKVDTGKVKSSIAVDTQAPDGQAALSGNVTYTLYAVSNDELGKYLDAVVAQQIDNADQQKVYDNGAKGVTFTNVQPAKDGLSAALSANGSIGPKIDESEVRQVAANKNYGEIQQSLEAITGVDSVDTVFSPFWVTRAPENIDKISVEFKLNEQ